MPGNIWDKPAVPHALDDEFESTTIDPSWDNAGALDFVTPMDPYAVVTPARVKLHTNHRPSWLSVQGGVAISKAYTLPTNCLIWTRMAPYITTAARVNGDSYNALYITATSGGIHDGLNAVRLMLRSWSVANSIEFTKSELGGFPVISTIVDTSTRGLSYEYIALHKIGSVFHAWAMTSGGIRTYMGNTTFLGAGTLDRILLIASGSETVPGSPIFGIDFLRVVESATYLP